MKYRPTIPPPRASRWTPAIVLMAFVFQSGLLQGGGKVSAIAGAGTGQDSGRAGDRLSPADFADPPVHVRPGSFWDWLNGSITREQITRDLEAMKQAGMRGGEIWDVAAAADPDRRVPAGAALLWPPTPQTQTVASPLHSRLLLGAHRRKW